MYKVFYNNSVIVIGEKLTKNESALQNVQLLNKMELNNFLNDFLTTENPHDFFLNGYNSEDLFEDLKTNFQFIEAAGGIVQNNLQDYLFIKRFGIWDLPKGKMKKNELPEKAAIREVEEETGVKILSITADLPSTYHIYSFKNNFILKKTYWYFMLTNDPEKPIPQLEEDITEAVWLNKRESATAIQSSYRSLEACFLPLFNS
jgi:ADP-ribose pyrophosphatase YjhB (NUDIX family)